MKSLALLICILSPLRAAERATDFPAAVIAAKAKQADIIALFHGSDWCPPGEELAALWQREDFAKGLGDGIVLLSIDVKEHPTDAERETADRNKACPVAVRSYPAIVHFDPEGRMFAKREGLEEIKELGAPGTALLRAVEVRKQRDALWAKADAASGPERANLFGKGLDLMNLGLGPKDIYKPILDAIHKADSKDRSGYVARYSFPGMKLISLVGDHAKAGTFAEADREIESWIAKKSLLSDQRQQALAAKFALYQRWPEKKGQLDPILKSIIETDAGSILGVGAAEYRRMLDL